MASATSGRAGAAGVEAGVSRVTIVAPKTRMDLSIPSDVPLADLLPVLLRHAGEDLADDGVAHGGWALSRLGGPPLDTGRSAAQLDIGDGELLYFTPRSNAAPEVVFDDVVDAVATATRDRGGRWAAADTRRFAVGFAVTALVGGIAAVLFAGPPQLTGGLVALAAGLVLLGVATLISRVAGDTATGGLFGLVAVGYGAVGGLLLLAGDRTLAELAAPDVLLAAAATVVFAALAIAGVGGHPRLVLGAFLVGVATGIGAGVSLAFGGGLAAAAAVVATVSFGSFSALPMLSYRLARLPTPAIPTGPEDLRSDTEHVDSQRVLALSDRADEIHIGLVGGVAVIVLGSVVLLAADASWPGWILSAVLAALLLLRARPYRGRALRLPVLVAGSAALGAVAVGTFLAGDLVARLGLVYGGLATAAAISVGYGLAVTGRRISPVWGRQLDIAEIMLMLAVVPVAAWAAGVYDWISTIG